MPGVGVATEIGFAVAGDILEVRLESESALSGVAGKYVLPIKKPMMANKNPNPNILALSIKSFVL